MILDRCPQGHRHHARALSGLSGDLYSRFQHSGNRHDIDDAVHLSRKAMSVCDSDGERSFFLSVLSYILRLRFHHLRSPDDINECISLNRGALSLHPPGHPARQESLNNLTKALKARYDQYGSVTDLEEAVRLDPTAQDLRSRIPGTPPQSQHNENYFGVGYGPLTYTSEPEEEQQLRPPLESQFGDHQVRTLLHLYQKTGLLMRYHRRGHGQEMSSSLAKAVQGKVQSLMRSRMISAHRHLVVLLDAPSAMRGMK